MKTSLWKDRDFRHYWSARVTSQIGTATSMVALPALVYAMTGSTFLTAIVTVLEAVPYLTFGLLSGALADRIDRRRMMVRADLLNVVLIASVPLAALAGMLTVWHVLAVAFLMHSVFVFFDGANLGALPTLVGRENIAEANGKVYGATTLIDLLVPASAGMLLVAIAPAQIVALTALTFLASALLIRSVRKNLSTRTEAATTALTTDIKEGLRFLWADKVVRISTLAIAAQAFSGGAFVGLLLPWADQVLGIRVGEDWRIGLLYAFWGLGGLTGAMLVARVTKRFGEARTVLWVLPVSAVLGIATAISTTLWVAMPLFVAWGAAYGLVTISATTLRQRITPDEFQSRVNTTGRMLSYGLGYPLGAFAGGMVATAFDARAGVIFGAIILLGGAAAAWMSPMRKLVNTPEMELVA